MKLFGMLSLAETLREVEQLAFSHKGWLMACGALHRAASEPQMWDLQPVPICITFQFYLENSHRGGLFIVLHETWQEGSKPHNSKDETAPLQDSTAKLKLNHKDAYQSPYVRRASCLTWIELRALCAYNTDNRKALVRGRVLFDWRDIHGLYLHQANQEKRAVYPMTPMSQKGTD